MEVVTDPKEVAEIQNKQYEKVFTKPKEESKVVEVEDFFKVTGLDNIMENMPFTYIYGHKRNKRQTLHQCCCQSRRCLSHTPKEM